MIKLRNGDYFDILSGKVIDSWDEITGALRERVSQGIISAKRLAGKLFTEDNKEVFLSGLNKVREWAVKAFKWFDPMGRIKNMTKAVTDRIYQQDVYIDGEDEPALYGNRFAKGHYFVKDANGTLIAINGWNEITGAVYNRDGEVLITKMNTIPVLRRRWGRTSTSWVKAPERSRSSVLICSTK